MCFCVTVLLTVVYDYLTWQYHSLDSVTRNKQSNQYGLKHCRASDKNFFLHRSIMPTTGESEEVNE